MCVPVGYFFTLYTRNPKYMCVCTIQLLLERERFHVIGFVAALPIICILYLNIIIYKIICCIISLEICRCDKQSLVSV